MLNEELAKEVDDEIIKPAAQFVWQTVGKPTVDKLLKAAENAVKAPIRKISDNIKNPKGKMTVKQLLRKDEGAHTVDIDTLGLRDFKRIAKKYGVDFAVMKSKYIEPEKYTVFFKARDRDAVEHLVAEYTARMMKIEKGQVRPSLLEHLKELKQKMAETPRKAVEKVKAVIR